jgi:transposase
MQGARGEAYLRLVRGVSQERILAVSIDVHKYFHQVGIHNAYGEVVVPGFRMGIFRADFDKLCEVIDHAVEATQAEVVFIGMEPTGHYYENLAQHLLLCYPHVRLVNSYAVKQNRNQKMLPHEKTDEIDCCAIGDLVLRNECFPYQPLRGNYLHLQQWTRYREAKEKSRTALRNQIVGHLDRIFPGLVRPKQPDDTEPKQLFSSIWKCQTAQRLIRLCPDPRRLAALKPAELVELYKEHNYRLGMITAKRIIDFARQVLLPDPEIVSARLPLLQYDLALLEVLDTTIEHAEKQMAHYLAHTKGQILTHIKGIGSLRAATYIAGIGNPEQYEHAGQTFRRSGLVSGRHDSGIHQRGGANSHITKVGDAHLRRGLVEITRGLCQWQPYFGQYRDCLIARGKHKGVATVATARKINGVLFAIVRDQTEFEPVDKRGLPLPPLHSLHEDKEEATTDMDPSETSV